jgi:flagellar basal-body rod modification protein FlgD
MITSVPRMNTTAPKIGAPATPPVGKAEPTPAKPVEPPKKGDAMGRDEFLKMLVAQLRHQDPLNPMDGQQMATQLAQFTTVEQLIAINASTTEQKATQEAIVKSLDALGKAQDAQKAEMAKLIEGQTAAGMVGKVGVFPGDQLIVGKDGEGTLMFDAKTLSGSGRVVVKDALGKVVSQADIATVVPGEQQMALGDLTWTPPLKAGQYRVTVEAIPAGGRPQLLNTFTVARITGMRYDNGTPVFIVGDGLRVPMANLTQLRS